jgi:hypothetical protein
MYFNIFVYYLYYYLLIILYYNVIFFYQYINHFEKFKNLKKLVDYEYFIIIRNNQYY